MKVALKAEYWRPFLPRRAIVMAQKPIEAQAAEPTPTLDTLQGIQKELQGCNRCKLCENRKNVIFGEGNPQANLIFIGDSPGEEEDLQGASFIGKEGELLDRMLQAIGLKRNQTYNLNLVKCRPSDNRNPELPEIQTCSSFLHRQLDLLQPHVVVALGEFAAQTLLKTEAPFSELRGRFHDYRGVKLMPTFHPSQLIKSPGSKKEAWIDLQLIAQELGLSIPKPRTT